MILERLYGLTAIDDQARLLDPVIDRVNTSLANATVTADFEVPGRHALLLSHASIIADPGAGQNIAAGGLQIFVFVRAPSGAIVRAAMLVRDPADGGALAADAIGFRSWQGQVLLPAPTTIRALGTFNAGVAANVVELGLVGMLVPLGNIERA